jgi:hypothetical protein
MVHVHGKFSSQCSRAPTGLCPDLSGASDSVVADPIMATKEMVHLVSPESSGLTPAPALTASSNTIFLPHTQFSFDTTVNPFAPTSDLALQYIFSSDTYTAYSPASRPRSVYSQQYVSSGMAGEQLRLRQRTLSQSPSERGGSTQTNADLGRSDVAEEFDSKTPLESPNLKKRALAETVEYPRRRAIIAVSSSFIKKNLKTDYGLQCEVCRSRKSRCDGVRPKCKLCRELKADCVYREPGVKLDAGDKMILERLNRIENLLTHRGASGSEMSTITNSPSNTASPDDDNNHLVTRGRPMHRLGTLASTPAQNVSNMPKSHTTPALNLLSWPKIRELVSKRWHPGAIVQQELQRSALDLTHSRPLDFAHAQLFILEFFEGVNLWYACVSPYKWHTYYGIAHARNFRQCPESCLVLLVLALGAAHRGGSISLIPEGTEAPGMPFFAAAWAMLPSLMLRTDVLTTQCQTLTAAYLFYLVRPLEAWNMLVSISLKLQLLVTVNLTPSDKQVCERIYWNTLLFERFVHRLTAVVTNRPATSSPRWNSHTLELSNSKNFSDCPASSNLMEKHRLPKTTSGISSQKSDSAAF